MEHFIVMKTFDFRHAVLRYYLYFFFKKSLFFTWYVYLSNRWNQVKIVIYILLTCYHLWSRTLYHIYLRFVPQYPVSLWQLTQSILHSYQSRIIVQYTLNHLICKHIVWWPPQPVSCLPWIQRWLLSHNLYPITQEVSL